MNVSVCVQHHPARAHLLPALLERLAPAEIVTDPDPDARRSPIRTYLRALELTSDDATHRVIIQDDAWPVANFRERAQAAIAEKPDELVALYLGGAPARSARLALAAHRRGHRWSDLARGDWCPTVATVWPAALIPDFLAFAASRRWASGGDDNVVGAFVSHVNLTVAILVPSIVQHPDEAPSLIGRRASAGKNKLRVAAVWLDGG